ncbi:MAG: 8-amino-7-oxononanoate synthase [Rhodospirillales bacterium]|nr:8-amino-7-oxononanoate synthase [Rhodospirillales bacterium]
MQRLAQELSRLRSASRHRSLSLPRGIDFTSNDYLGLSGHPELRRAVVDWIEAGGTAGASGSRLLRGHQSAHAELEAFAAGFFGCERALYFSTGFLANLALFTTLPDRRDVVVYDERVHASVKEGVHAGHAKLYRVKHNDVDGFEDAIVRARRGGARDVWLAVESVYSMDGDIAPVADLHALACTHDAVLIVDEAHSTGIFGPTGRGFSEGRYDERLIVLHTCGKALGVAGGLVCGPAVAIDYLINAARPFIYSTAPPPYVARAVHRALELIDEEPERRSRLLALMAFATERLALRAGSVVAAAGTQIIPVILGAESTAMAAAAALQRAGFDVRAIRPPTVPAGTSRLRISIGADRSEDEIVALADALAKVLPAFAEGKVPA